MHKLGFVGRAITTMPARSEEGDVERACVGCAIGADETCPVDGEAYRNFWIATS